MKINILLLALLFFGCNNAPKEQQNNSQLRHTDTVVLDSLQQNITPYSKWKNFKNDSLGYLVKNFVDRKGAYKNKPLDTLLDMLELPVLSYNTMSSYPPYEKEVRGMRLRFENDLSIHRKLELRKSPVLLNIYFKKPLEAEEVHAFVIKNKVSWTPAVRSFFQNHVVEDIEIVKDRSNLNK